MPLPSAEILRFAPSSELRRLRISNHSFGSRSKSRNNNRLRAICWFSPPLYRRVMAPWRIHRVRAVFLVLLRGDLFRMEGADFLDVDPPEVPVVIATKQIGRASCM